MSDNEKQEALLIAIHTLKVQYKLQQPPCVALLIARYYRLLSVLNISPSKQEKYFKQSKSWLVLHAANPRHSKKIQDLLNDFIQLNEFY
jgi:hypothetical protein